MHNTQNDIVTLNRRYLLLIKNMADRGHPMLDSCAPKSTVKIIQEMSLEEIDRLAEGMVAPCFHLHLDNNFFHHISAQKSEAHRRAYMSNVLSGRKIA